MGEQKRAIAPAAAEVSIPIKDDDRRVLALEGVDPVLCVGSDRADHGEGLPWGQLGPILDQGIGVFTGAYGSH
jgi:hypothetical protein